MRLHLYDVNNVLKGVRERVGSCDPMDADALLLYNDVRGTCKSLVQTNQRVGKVPVYVIQHGRGSTRDYDKPNSFPFLGDKYLAWGQAAKDHMTALGYGDKVEIVGCPLLAARKPKANHPSKHVLFVPVNADHEEPENLLVYYELVKAQYASAQKRLIQFKPALNKEWGLRGKLNVPFYDLASFDLAAKILHQHDKNLYHKGVFLSTQGTPTHNEILFTILSQMDCLVTLDVSTTEILAMALDIPIVCCDVYEWREIGGKPYVGVDRLKSKAVTYCGLSDLKDAVEEAIYHPERLKDERAAESEYELTVSEKDPVGRILNVIGYKEAVPA